MPAISFLAWRMGLPIIRVTSSAISASRASISVTAARHKATRSATLVRPQERAAARAPSSTWSTMAGSASGTRTASSSVKGSSTTSSIMRENDS